MRRTGFEPAQALSQQGLNLSRLTAPAPPQGCLVRRGQGFKKVVEEITKTRIALTQQPKII